MASHFQQNHQKAKMQEIVVLSNIQLILRMTEFHLSKNVIVICLWYKHWNPGKTPTVRHRLETRFSKVSIACIIF